jgi:hypothetical protein
VPDGQRKGGGRRKKGQAKTKAGESWAIIQGIELMGAEASVPACPHACPLVLPPQRCITLHYALATHRLALRQRVINKACPMSAVYVSRHPNPEGSYPLATHRLALDSADLDEGLGGEGASPGLADNAAGQDHAGASDPAVTPGGGTMEGVG